MTPTTLSPRERRILAALAETIIPGSARIPRPGPRTVDRVEEFLSVIPPLLQHGFGALLWLLELRTVPRHLRPFTRLSEPTRLKVLERMVHGSFTNRQLLRMAAATIKAAHFYDPKLYQELGCAYELEVPAQVERPSWWELVTRGEELTDDDELECDVVIVGTGAGGAAAAKALAEHGLAVVIVEEGEFHTRERFNGNTIAMQRLMYRDFGGVLSVGNVPVVIPIGRAVGGTTVINSGTSLPPPDAVLQGWVDDFGLVQLGPDRLRPYVDKTLEYLEVAPSEDKYIGDVGRLIAKGCDALGYAHGPLPRNAPGCDAQARCAFGCPTDAKKSTNVSYIPAALKANAFLFTQTTAEEVLIQDGRAVGLIARTQGGATIRIRARATVLACGSLLTPLLLLRQRLANRSLQIGRNLTIHPAMGMAGEFDELTDGFRSVPQGYGIDEFWPEGLLFEGGTAPPELLAASTHEVGPSFMAWAEALDRQITFGMAIKDTSRGQVLRGPFGRPLITYSMNSEDLNRLRRGTEILARVFFAAGATRVHLPIRGFATLEDETDIERFRQARIRPRDYDLTAYHPLGTTRLGIDPRKSVVGPDHQCHDVPGLYICDGGAVPSSLGVNPQITIMAMATRAADLLAARLQG
ncbi:MAG: GMC family oxidoreductase [bacterium]